MPIPVSLDDAKLHLRHAGEQLSAERQSEIQGFIDDAAAWAESYTGHILEAREVVEQVTGFNRLALRAWPIKPDAVAAVTYELSDGATIAVADVRVDTRVRPARLWLLSGSNWPVTGRCTNATITVRAGYEAGDQVPGNFRRTMLILIAAYDADREGGDLFAKAEATARALCDRANLRLRRV